MHVKNKLIVFVISASDIPTESRYSFVAEIYFVISVLATLVFHKTQQTV